VALPLGGTIVARASAPGHAARAIVRLSGPESFAAVESLAGGERGPMQAAGAGSDLEPAAPTPLMLRARGAHAIRMRLAVCGEMCECPALALSMPAPRSFTGEDCIELLVPGNPALVDAIVDALLRGPGVRAAGPGDFMARAHAQGRIALGEAERVALEIAAGSARELAAARHVQDNPLVNAAREASVSVAEMLALVEAGIDFTDSEDVVAIPREALVARVRDAARELSRWIEGSVPLESACALPMVALRGAPNAGKSSLFNAMLGRTRAVASPVAGTTRDAIVEEIELPDPRHAGAPVRALIVDTPGIEDPRSAIDALMQSQARIGEQADVILLCEPMPSVRGGAQVLPEGATVIHVATRSDEAPPAGAAIANGALRTSAVTGEGIPELMSAVAEAIVSRGCGTGADLRIGVLGRHREAMAMAAEWLSRACATAESGSAPSLERPELVADSLRAALDALGTVTGDITPDDVLGLVFSRFCIGK
jgi:tRNA modification GTPase